MTRKDVTMGSKESWINSTRSAKDSNLPSHLSSHLVYFVGVKVGLCRECVLRYKGTTIRALFGLNLGEFIIALPDGAITLADAQGFRNP